MAGARAGFGRALTNAGLVPLPLCLVDELAPLDLSLLREVVRDLLQLVGTALQLFAGVALLFWYVLRLFLSSRR